MNSPAINKRSAIGETTLDEGGIDGSDVGGWNGLSQVTRRTFCSELLLTSTVVVLRPRSVAGEAVNPQETTIRYPPMKIEGAEALMVGSSIYFEYPTRNDPAVLLRSSDGEYTAYSRKCSHAGCSVEFDAARRCLKCPCHQGIYDARIGHVIFGPPRRPLDQIALEMRAGNQIWATGKCIGRNADRYAQTPGQSKYFSDSGG